MTTPIGPNVRLAMLSSKKFIPQPPMPVADVLPEWIERFPSDAKFLKSVAKNLNRKSVRKVCSQRGTYSIRQKFLAVMLWGYGPYAVGAARTLKITKEPEFEFKLREVYNLAKSGRHIDAISFMAIDPIKNFGPAYGTKFVYFCSPKNVCAPIYDMRVRDWLGKYAKNELYGASLKRIQWHTNSYLAWSQWLQVQAKLLKTNWEDLEYLIFEDAKIIPGKAKQTKEQ